MSEVMLSSIQNLQKRLKDAEQQRDEAIEALRPFAREKTHAEIAPQAAFARAAALVEEHDQKRT